jgi:hypothetical protein
MATETPRSVWVGLKDACMNILFCAETITDEAKTKSTKSSNAPCRKWKRKSLSLSPISHATRLIVRCFGI